MLSPNDYQKLASRTLIARPDREYTDLEIMLVWNALGVAGEAGEYADSIKKMIFHNHPLDLAQLASELGDLLWYVAASASKLGLDLETIMQGNLDKLARRYPDGYSASASRARVDLNQTPAQPEATGWQFVDYPSNQPAAPSILDRYPMRQPDIGMDAATAAQLDRATELAREQQRLRELQRAHGERLARGVGDGPEAASELGKARLVPDTEELAKHAEIRAAGARSNEALAEPVKLGGLTIDPSELAINAEAIRKAWRDGIQDALKQHAEQIEQSARELGATETDIRRAEAPQTKEART